MKIISWLFASNIFVPALALAAQAHEGAHEPAPMNSLIWPAVNFAIYAFFMFRFYRKYGRPALLSRAATFEQHLRKAAQVLDDAENNLQSAEDRLHSMPEEQLEIKERLAEEGTHLATRIIAQAEQSAAAIRKDVGRRIERELAAARAEVRDRVIARAAELARHKLATTLSAEEDNRLRQDAVRGLFSVQS